MQQVGGAFGLAALATVGSHYTNAQIASIAPTIGRGVAQLDPGVVQQLLSKLHLTSPSELVGALAYIGGFPTGATHAFLVGVFMMLAGSAVVWIFLDVKHEELATETPDDVPSTSADRTPYDPPRRPRGSLDPGGVVAGAAGWIEVRVPAFRCDFASNTTRTSGLSESTSADAGEADAVADGEQDDVDPLVGDQRGVHGDDGAVVVALRVEHPAVAEHVVEHDQAAGARSGSRSPRSTPGSRPCRRR